MKICLTFNLNINKRSKNFMRKKYSNLLKYHFENALSKGSNFVLFLLAISSVSAVIMVFLESFFGLADGFNFNTWWDSLTSIIKLGKGNSGEERLITFIYWALNVAISGTIIAFLTAKVVTLFQKLNSGKSQIIDNKHYLILGWNNNIFQIFNEIAEANLNQSKPTVVCFSALANTDMQSRLSTSKVNNRRIRIITRSGNLYNEDELLRLNMRKAKSVIVLNDESVVDFNIESTLLVTRKILSDIKVPVIAQFNNSENIDVFSRSDQNLLPVNNNSVMASITTQAIRNKEISEVILDFLDYDGDEIYFFPPDNLVGKTFDECKMQAMNISIFGIFNSNNTISLNPEGNTLIKSDDKLVAIAEDDDIEIDFNTDTISQKSQLTKIEDKKEVKSILFLGDSFTEGQGAESWINKFNGKYKDYQILNGGFLGAGFQQFKLINDYLSDYNIEKVFVLYIGNDLRRDVFQFNNQQIACLKNSLNCKGHEIFFGSPPNKKDIMSFLDNLKNMQESNDVNRKFTFKLIRRSIKKKLSELYVIKIPLDFLRSKLYKSNNEKILRNFESIDELIEIHDKNISFINLKMKDEIINKKKSYETIYAKNYILKKTNNFFECDFDNDINNYYIDGHPNSKGYESLYNCIKNILDNNLVK